MATRCAERWEKPGTEYADPSKLRLSKDWYDALGIDTAGEEASEGESSDKPHASVSSALTAHCMRLFPTLGHMPAASSACVGLHKLHCVRHDCMQLGSLLQQAGCSTEFGHQASKLNTNNRGIIGARRSQRHVLRCPSFFTNAANQSDTCACVCRRA